MAVLPDRAGIDTLYVVVRATVTLQPRIALAPEQLPPVMADEYYGDPAAPNLLDPKTPQERLGDEATPACFAPSAGAWLPRREFAGTYDAAWQRSRAPYLPDDFDPRFLQCATGELCFERFLQGTEPVRISGMTPEGPIEFAVPTVRPQIEVIVAGSPATPRAELETLWIEPDENRPGMTWLAELGCAGKVLRVEKVTISLPARGAPS